VSGFDTWKPVNDGNAILVLLDFPDAASAQSCMSDPSLAEAA
jgi:hypothetical protein